MQGLVSGPLPVGMGAFAAAAASTRRQPLPPASGGGSLLGWHANAAAAEAAALPRVGPLLPAWRQVAHVLAPLFHPVSPSNRWKMVFVFQSWLPCI